MDMQLEKYKLMEWLVNINDETIILKLKELKNKLSDASEYTSISEVEQLFIEAGLKDIKNGNLLSHKQVMEEVSKKYGI
jgi:predicted transcriptional regulator